MLGATSTAPRPPPPTPASRQLSSALIVDPHIPSSSLLHLQSHLWLRSLESMPGSPDLWVSRSQLEYLERMASYGRSIADFMQGVAEMEEGRKRQRTGKDCSSLRRPKDKGAADPTPRPAASPGQAPQPHAPARVAAPLHWCGCPRSLMQRPPRTAHLWQQLKPQRLLLLPGPEEQRPLKRQQRRLPGVQPASQQRKPLGLQRHGSPLPRRGKQHTQRWRRPGRQAPAARLCERRRRRWRRRAPSVHNGAPGTRSDTLHGVLHPLLLDMHVCRASNT